MSAITIVTPTPTPTATASPTWSPTPTVTPGPAQQSATVTTATPAPTDLPRTGDDAVWWTVGLIGLAVGVVLVAVGLWLRGGRRS